MKDRHGRGLRGPLSLPNPYSNTALLVRPNKMSVFSKEVAHAIKRINRVNPTVLTGIDIGVAEVPGVSTWHIGQVPLASATAATESEPARIVLFRRPLDLRSADSAELRELVFQTLAQQLSELTGVPLWEIAPDLTQD